MPEKSPNAAQFEQVSFPPEVPKSSLEIILPDGTKLRGGSAQELAVLARELRAR